MKGKIQMRSYVPEGGIINNEENLGYLSSLDSLIAAKQRRLVLEARAESCSPAHDLVLNLPACKAVIPREECAIGIAEGRTKDIAIISRVGKPVAFTVKDIREENGEKVAILSRTDAQKLCLEEYLLDLEPGQIIDATVTHIEQFGCFVDIGCGISSMIPIDAISVSRISHPSDRFEVGDNVKAILKCYDGEKFYLSHKELLGTWEENAGKFSAGETVRGIVRSIEPYGIFIELAPNLAGLAEPRGDVYAGQTASVYIKSINPEKMKIKLIIVDTYDFAPEKKCEYFITEGRLHHWRYSPRSCEKIIESWF